MNGTPNAGKSKRMQELKGPTPNFASRQLRPGLARSSFRSSFPPVMNSLTRRTCLCYRYNSIQAFTEFTTHSSPKDTIVKTIIHCTDTQTDVLAGFPASATCVQKFDDSRVLQIALLIAFSDVLHRCGSLDIPRYGLYVRYI